MRRTAVAVIGLGCAIGVFAAGGTNPASARAAGRSQASGGQPSASAPASGTPSKPVTGAASAPAGSASTAFPPGTSLKTIEYDGYSIKVPSSWPVYHLDTDPGQCVRYDINAVYLGNPGANQNCPSNLIGRTQTITITDAGVSGTPTQEYQRAAVAQGGLGSNLPGSSGAQAEARPSGFSRMDRYAQQHQFQGTTTTGLSVTGTYGMTDTTDQAILHSMHRVRAKAGKAQQGSAAARDTSRSQPLTGQSAAKPATPAATTKPAVTTKPAATAKPSTTGTLLSNVSPTIPKKPLSGFDACTAPSLNAMKAFKSRYSAAGVYIGGQNMACGYGNLSKSWVSSAHSAGWSLLPIYVGLQAPCNSFPNTINAKSAATQGTQAADNAVIDATNLGLGRGAPIYFDMESYNSNNGSCKAAVLSFLDAWTREVHAKGYVSGVYSSASTGVADLVAAGTVNGHTMTEPDALWFALWDKGTNLTGTPYLPINRWASDRVKQYQGNTNQKISGYTLNIDADWVGGAVSGP